LLILSAPVLLLAIVAIRFTSPGPAIYKQRRVGQNGKEFVIFKLRTMRHNAEAATGAVWSVGHDNRVTGLGKFLRETKLDEFPQLVNVLLGQMSLIGPRPERPEFVNKLQWQFPNYLERHLLKPGITGLAQLRLPPDSDLESVGKKLGYDLFYVQNVNPYLDLRVLCFTAVYALSALGAYLWQQVTLPKCEMIPPEPIDALSLRIDSRHARDVG
jgi:lipopolysaccharide/colanic/teichoic acid biosynthesis glycosyltransferase